MRALFMRPAGLWAATALSCVVSLALLIAVDARAYGLPTLIYVPLILAALAGGKRAGFIAATLLTAAYVTSVALTSAYASIPELLALGTIRLAVSVMIGFLVGSHVDYNRQLIQSALGRANLDHLTGLGTRHALDERWAKRRRTASRGFGVVMIDMDGLKVINDTAGHAAGDAALQMLATSIRRGSRSHDLLARLGGDEFVVVAEVDSSSELELLAARIEQNAGERSVEASIGVAFSPHDGEELADLIHVADHRMYAQKFEKRAANASAS